MKKLIHYAPSSEEMARYSMYKSSDGHYDYFRIHLAMTTETQKMMLSKRFGIALRILEDEPYLTLYTMKDA